jgi:mRNA interferase MazF
MESRLQRGDVVLVPFPYTDLSATKTRPAVVVSSDLYHQARSECLLAYISSQVTQADPQLDYVLADWRAAGLLKPSFMRPKIAAIDPALVVHRVGTLSTRDQSAVDNGLRRALALTVITVKEVLAEMDFTTAAAAQIQTLAEKSVAVALALHVAGKDIDLTHLREQLCASAHKPTAK